jgi:hypothetical protein
LVHPPAQNTEWEVDGTHPHFCIQWWILVLTVLNVLSSATTVEPSGYVTSELIIICKINIREIGSDGGRWMELAQDLDQWQVLVLSALNVQVMLPERYLICKIQ